MQTYYQILNLPPTSTRLEIEQALDVHYNQCRQLVTHHDPNVVNQANQAMQVLEKIRSTLMDAGRRSAYDAAISGNVSGLADPTSAPLPPPPLVGYPTTVAFSQTTPRHLPPTQASAQRAWVCPKCASANTANSQFCKKCGVSLADPCPACNSLVEKGAQFCTNCGVNILNARRKRELKNDLRDCQSALDLAAKNSPVLDANLPELKQVNIISGTWSIVAGVAGIVYLTASPTRFPGFNLTGLTLALVGQPGYLSYAQNDIILVGVALFLVAAVSISLALVSKVSPLKGFGATIAVFLFMVIPGTVQSSLIMAMVPESTATAIAAIATTGIFIALTLRIMSHVRRGSEKLKPYLKWLPQIGCLGGLFTLSFLTGPILFSLYLVIDAQANSIINSYGIFIWFVNAVQFFVVAFILMGYALMSWRTSQVIELRYRQAVLQRTEKMTKLTRQIQALRQAINEIDLQV